MFDLDRAISEWKKSLRAHASLQDGDLAELEDHFRGKIEDLVKAGLTPEDAFAKSRSEFDPAARLDADYRRARARERSFLGFRIGPALAWSGLKIALRKIRRQKGASFINIAGLALGMAGCILIFLFVRSEWSYDAFQAKAGRIVRAAVLENYSKEERFFNTVTPFPLGPALKSNFSEVAGFARVVAQNSVLGRGDTMFFERFHMVDPSFFELFSFPLLRGDRATALSDPGSVVLTESEARKIFGREDPIGKSLFIQMDNRKRDFTVTAVAKDVPENSSIRFAILISLDLAKDIWRPGLLQSWTNVFPETYVELRPGASAAALESKLDSLSRLALGQEYKPGVYTIRLQPMRTIHLDKSFPSGIEPVSDPAYSYILAGIALLVLLLACVNFITLSIGRAATRAREVGIRKTVGAQRGELMRQFWGETLLTAFLSLLLGLVLAQLALPAFRGLSGKALTLDFSPSTVGALLVLMVAAGLAAGFYPAMVLSGFRPVDVLRGRLSLGRRTGLRKGLVIFQFVLSIALIVCTLVMSRQLRFLRTKDLGFKSQQVLVLRTNSPRAAGIKLLDLFRNEASRRTDVLAVAGTAYTFGEEWIRAGFTANDGVYRELYLNVVSPEFLRVMGISLADGRDFAVDRPGDLKGSILINEALAREFRLNPALNRPLPGKNFPPHEIVGVIKDFHFQSLHDPIRPLAIVLDPAAVMKGIENINTSSPGYIKILLRLKADDIPATMSALRAMWARLAPDLPFDYSFLDRDLDQQYRQDERWGAIIRSASIFAVLIACLGLFGLTALVIAQRFKEIGIRKVLGSTAPGVVGLLSWDFLKLVLLSNVLAWPLAYFAMSRWLQGFAYHRPIGAGSFILAAVLGAVVAEGTIGVLAVRAALSDPVDAIRYE